MQKFDFLVPCRLTILTQDIVARQFDSNAFIKVYIVGASIWYQALYVVCDTVYEIARLQIYIKRSVCGRWKQAGDVFGFGRQYDPDKTAE